MKNFTSYIIFLLIFTSISILIGRPFRVSKVPHGNKFSCNTCHTNGGGTPRNPFGLDVQARVSPNGMETFWGPDLASIDSDGDGFTNGEELQDPNGTWIEGTSNPGDPNLVTRPGDPNDHPSATTVKEDGTIPTSFALYQNYPNPFNPSTKITFDISQAGNVKIDIYNALGQLIKVLADNEFNQGRYVVVWNGANDFGKRVSSGMYIYRLIAGDYVKSRRMILMK